MVVDAAARKHHKNQTARRVQTGRHAKATRRIFARVRLDRRVRRQGRGRSFLGRRVVHDDRSARLVMRYGGRRVHGYADVVRWNVGRVDVLLHRPTPVELRRRRDGVRLHPGWHMRGCAAHVRDTPAGGVRLVVRRDVHVRRQHAHVFVSGAELWGRWTLRAGQRVLGRHVLERQRDVRLLQRNVAVHYDVGRGRRKRLTLTSCTRASRSFRLPRAFARRSDEREKDRAAFGAERSRGDGQRSGTTPVAVVVSVHATRMYHSDFGCDHASRRISATAS